MPTQYLHASGSTNPLGLIPDDRRFAVVAAVAARADRTAAPIAAAVAAGRTAAAALAAGASAAAAVQQGWQALAPAVVALTPRQAQLLRYVARDGGFDFLDPLDFADSGALWWLNRERVISALQRKGLLEGDQVTDLGRAALAHLEAAR